MPGAKSIITTVAQATADPEELVREYAAWPLGKIGGLKAKQTLGATLVGEISDYVKREIVTVLLEM